MFSRRMFLKVAAGLGAAATFLVEACGGGDNNDDGGEDASGGPDGNKDTGAKDTGGDAPKDSPQDNTVADSSDASDAADAADTYGVIDTGYGFGEVRTLKRGRRWDAAWGSKRTV